MQYSEIDLQIEDIMWFGIDLSGSVIAFTSGGCGAVPAFICRSREETEKVAAYFSTALPDISEPHLLIDQVDTPQMEDAINLARKGIFSFDVSFDSGHEDEYVKIAYPSIPLKFADIPLEIRKILFDHIVEADAEFDQYIHVKHAFDISQ